MWVGQPAAPERVEIAGAPGFENEVDVAGKLAADGQLPAGSRVARRLRKRLEVIRGGMPAWASEVACLDPFGCCCSIPR